MSTVLPHPVELEMPPGDVAAVDQLVRQVAGAARCLAEVDERLIGAAGAAPGWSGADATAASAQVAAVAGLVHAARDAMAPVIGRLTRHAEFLLMTRRRVEGLREEQGEQFRDAWQRWSRIQALRAQIMIGGPEARAVVDEVEAGEASRRRRHALVLEELADDAAATARVLVAACAVVGGSGRPGDGERVTAHLALALPGWGDLELGRRGRALAGELTGGTPQQRAAAAADAAPVAGHVAFANALLAGLGVRGFAYLLEFLDHDALGPDSSVARLLAAALGAAVPTDRSHDPVADVLDAEYVRTDDRYGTSDAAAAGLATVLAAGLSLPSGGVPTRTVAEWSRQLLLREHEQREPVGRRSIDGAPVLGDPAALAIGILARRADPAVSAALLGEPDVWEALLRRTWGDGGAALGDVVTQAGREPGASGAHALRTGLATVGAGLAADDPALWAVNRDTLAAVAPALGDAAVAHLDVAVDALQVGVDGHTQGDRIAVLHGLGYVTLDRGAAAAIEQALSGRPHVEPTALAGVLGAYVAVQEHAQRTDHALDALEDRETAQNKQWLWDHSVHHLPELIPGGGGVVAGLVESGVAIGLDMDGTWEERADRGLVLDRSAAAAVALAAGAPQTPGDIRAVTDVATGAFDRTTAVLGERRAPRSPETDWTDAVRDVGLDFEDQRKERPRVWRGIRLPAPR